MPLLRVKVMVGARLVASPARPFAPSMTVQDVLDKILESTEELKLKCAVHVYPTAEERKEQRTELAIEDLASISVADLSALGFFLVAPCTSPIDVTPHSSCDSQNTPSSAAPSSGRVLQSALDAIMRNSQRQLVLPARSPSTKLRFMIFNALVSDLEACGLGWLRADAGDTGKRLLDSLSYALQYMLPFEENGALQRRSCYIPERFTASFLKVHELPGPSLSDTHAHDTKADFAGRCSVSSGGIKQGPPRTNQGQHG